MQKAVFKVVLNLRTEQEGSLDEKPKVEALGMEYFNIPIGREGFSPQIVSKFRDILAESANRPILIHCASSNRVGAMWYIHQVLEGESESSALEEAKKAGLRLRNPRRTRQRLRRPEQAGPRTMTSSRTALVLDDETRHAAQQLALRYGCSMSEAIRRAVVHQRDAAIGVPAERRQERRQILERLFELFEGNDPDEEIRHLNAETTL